MIDIQFLRLPQLEWVTSFVLLLPTPHLCFYLTITLTLMLTALQILNLQEIKHTINDYSIDSLNIQL